MNLPYDYYSLVIRVIDMIGLGRTKTSACDEVGIAVSTFNNYVKNTAELQALLTDAEERGYDAMAEALLEIDRHKHYGQSDPKMAKVISENIKFLLSKRRPKTYGERIQIDHNVTADRAIIDALLAGRNRAMNSSTQEVIDITPVVIEDKSDEQIMAEMLEGSPAISHISPQ